MLNTVYIDALKKREETLSILKGEKFEQIIDEAKHNWIEYIPQKQDSEIAGIDGRQRRPCGLYAVLVARRH